MTNVFEEQVSIPANDVMLVGRLAYPERSRPTCAVLLAGAHPLLGGNQNNNVITALRTGLAAHGVIASSFEYRKPDHADPEHWTAMLNEFWVTHHVAHESDWRNDARSAADFLYRNARCPLVLIGYSFGCWAVAEMAINTSAAALVCISPNPIDHDLSVYASAMAPLLVISSDNDFSCTPAQLRVWLDSLQTRHTMHSLSGAKHFFRGREPELVRLVIDFLRSQELIGD